MELKEVVSRIKSIKKLVSSDDMLIEVTIRIDSMELLVGLSKEYGLDIRRYSDISDYLSYYEDGYSVIMVHTKVVE